MDLTDKWHSCSERQSPLISRFDLAACATEPIHIPGSMQPHGALLATAPHSSTITWVSANCEEYFRVPAAHFLGTSIEEKLTQWEIFPEQGVASLKEGTLKSLGIVKNNSRELPPLVAVAHKVAGRVIVEFERHESERLLSFYEVYPLLPSFLSKLQEAETLTDLFNYAVQEVRKITNFDRVLLYRFDDEWNGEVLAESKQKELPEYLGLHFPASDIPEQARRLYHLNRLRLIVDANYTPVPLLSSKEDTSSLDLSFSVLRSVSPVHLEYLRNMKVTSSMSISILKEGKLWGLISCHHATRRLPLLNIRLLCDYLGQVFTLQLTALERKEEYETQLLLKSGQTELLKQIAQGDSFLAGLATPPDSLLHFMNATGAALVQRQKCILLGDCCSEEEVLDIAELLFHHHPAEVFATNTLSQLIPDAGRYKNKVSGVLGIVISPHTKTALLWFRPETLQTIHWGGDPTKAVTIEEGVQRLHPRKSFARWKEVLSGKSTQWSKSEKEAALEFRNALVEIVLKKAEEHAELSDELARSNKELEAFAYSVSHDLRAPFRHIVGYSELLKERLTTEDKEAERYLSTVIKAAYFAGNLVDSLLHFSQMGRTALQKMTVDMAMLFNEVISEFQSEGKDRSIKWTIHPLPAVHADPIMIKLVVQNLLANALKFTKAREETTVEIGHETESNEEIFFIRDNGVGFDMKYIDKLFGVFQRLHRPEEYEGTGIGLANVRRIVSRHGGRTWAVGEVGKGATFYFSLPKEKK